MYRLHGLPAQELKNKVKRLIEEREKEGEGGEQQVVESGQQVRAISLCLFFGCVQGVKVHHSLFEPKILTGTRFWSAFCRVYPILGTIPAEYPFLVKPVPVLGYFRTRFW